MRLNYHSVVDAYGGHGIVALELARQFLFRGVELDWYPSNFHHGLDGIPEHIKPCIRNRDDSRGGFTWIYAQSQDVKNKHTVRYLVHETPDIPKPEIEFFNATSLALATPSTWNARALKDRGYKHKVTVLPHGVCPEYSFKSLNQTGPLIFGTVGELINKPGFRKNPFELIQAFQRAFPTIFDGSVQLWIKTQPNSLIGQVNDPRVKIFAEHYTTLQMQDWYSKLSVYVNPSRGEGWCMPMHEAMAVGRPFISTNWGGPTEYLDKSSGWYIPHRLIKQPNGTFYVGQRQAQPDFDYLTDLMRWIHESDRTELVIRGINASKRAHQFDWNTAGAIAYGLCEEFDLLTPG